MQLCLPNNTGNDIIEGNGARDVIFGCGGDNGKKYDSMTLLISCRTR